MTKDNDLKYSLACLKCEVKLLMTLQSALFKSAIKCVKKQS